MWENYDIRKKVLVHNKHYGEAFFVTKFLNGLKEEIQRKIDHTDPKWWMQNYYYFETEAKALPLSIN
jgi:hypothetical protein